MKGFRKALRALSWGSAAGLATLALDQLFAFLTLGFPIRVDLAAAGLYVAAGAAVAGAAAVAGYLAGRPRASALGIVASTSAVVYAVSVFERVEQALARPFGAPAAWTAGALALLGLAGWVLVLRAIVGGKSPPTPQPGAPLFQRGEQERRGGGEGATRCALILASVSVALGLAVNRNLVERPFEPRALAADAGVLVLGLAFAFGVRIAGAPRAALAGAVLAGVAAVAVAWEPRVEPAPAADAPPHPHLVLLVIDTLRQDVFRDVVEQTPEGRRFRDLLGGAAWFDRAVAAAPWTAPSVASILTGLYPPEHGFGVAVTADHNRPLTRLSASVTPLAVHLSERGYQTVAIVTNPLLHPVSGIARGFERFEVLGGPTTKMPLLTVLARTGLLRRDYYQDAAVVRRRLAFGLRGVAGDRPLFLWLHLMDPHEPLHRHRGLGPDPRGEQLDGAERLYRDETRFALSEASRMIELLDAAGVWSNAAFVLVSDHGEMFARDGHGHLPPGRPRSDGHGHALYEELMRVPLVIRPPGGLAGDRRIGVLASHVDLFGTVRDLLGLDLPRLAGERLSLAPWLGAEPSADGSRGRAYTLIGANKDGPPQQGVLTESHKLIRHVNGDLPDELFDLETDPEERRNLAGVDPAVLDELDQLLELTWSQLRQVTDSTETLEYDAETRRRLEALGYL